MRKAFRTTIEVVVVCDTEAEASDTISELLRSGDGSVESGFLDWRYPNWDQSINLNLNCVQVSAFGTYREGDAFRPIDGTEKAEAVGS